MAKRRKLKPVAPEIKKRLAFEKAFKKRSQMWHAMKQIFAWAMLIGFTPRNDYPVYTPVIPKRTNKFAEANPHLYIKDDTDKLKEILIDKYGKQCMKCKSPKPLVDHITARYRGGNNTIDNVQLLCWSCNSEKGLKTIDYRPF